MDPGIGPALIDPIAADTRLGPMSRLVYRLLIGLFRRAGWQAAGTLPADRKFVILGASHTSNWDFIVFLGTIEALGRRVRFIGKHSLFAWPIGGFMRAMGGVPVRRDTRQDLVAQVVAQFARHDDFALVVAAEGTRPDHAVAHRLLPDRPPGQCTDRLRRARLCPQARRHWPGDPPHWRL